MTKDKLYSIIEAVTKIREIATDEQALQIKDIYPTWKPETQYIIGERVLYDGDLYKALAIHTSQADFAQDVAANLFTKVLAGN